MPSGSDQACWTPSCHRARNTRGTGSASAIAPVFLRKIVCRCELLLGDAFFAAAVPSAVFAVVASAAGAAVWVLGGCVLGLFVVEVVMWASVHGDSGDEGGVNEVAHLWFGVDLGVGEHF